MRQVVFLLVVISLGCESVELMPRINPRFSVAYIQEIDDSGAQFASTIYDFGSEEIEEYGFLYSENGLPRFDNAEVVKESGKPGKQFVLKGEHSMRIGKRYFVVAFLKTSSGYVFSEPYSFTSKGAAGFIYEKLVHNASIFFGDTLTVYGSNLSTNIANYEVTFHRKKATVIEVQQTYFKFTVPDFDDFSSDKAAEDVFLISIKIVDRTIVLNLQLPFRNPSFDDVEIQRIDYGGTLAITGKFLKDIHLKIAVTPYPLERIYGSNTTILSANAERIVFKPNPAIAGAENFVTLQIRGKQYDLGSTVFEYNPTEIDPDQHIQIGFDDYFTIKGRNFNPALASHHIGIINGQRFDFNYESSDGNSITLRLWRQGFNFSRINEFYIKTNEQLSQHAVRLELTDPDIPFLKNTIPSLRLRDFLFAGNMVSFEGKGFALGNKEIFEIDIEDKTINTVRALQIAATKLAYTFSVADGDNWYIGGGHTSNYNPFNRSFFVFNLRTREIRRLPDLPFNQWIPQFAHVVENNVYLEGGFEPDTGEDHQLRYKFDIRTEQWVRLPDKVSKRGIVGRTVPFRYNGKYFAYGVPTEYGDDGSALFEFDAAADTWRFIARYYEVGPVGVKADEVFLLGSKAILVGNEVFVLDMETLQLRRVTNLAHPSYLTCQFERNMAFMANEKIYLWDCEETFWELDPERFRYD